VRDWLGVTQMEGQTRYVYDAVGHMSERILPDRVHSIYRVDPLGRIRELTHKKGYETLDRFRYAYDPAGNISQIGTAAVAVAA